MYARRVKSVKNYSSPHHVKAHFGEAKNCRAVAAMADADIYALSG